MWPEETPRDPRLPARVRVVEVGPRDGLQNMGPTVPTDVKVRFVDLLSAAGLPVVEVTSFVSPQAIPQLGDAAAVFAAVEKRPGARYPVLTPNMRGMERAVAAGARDIAVFTAASEGFTRRNINMTIAESLRAFAPVVELARREGIGVRGYVSMAFGCPYEGRVPPARVLDVARRLFELGVDEVSVGDTIGGGPPPPAAGPPRARCAPSWASSCVSSRPGSWRRTCTTRAGPRWPTCLPPWNWASPP